MSAVVENNEQNTDDPDMESDVISDEDATIKPVIIRMFDLHQNNRAKQFDLKNKMWPYGIS